MSPGGGPVTLKARRVRLAGWLAIPDPLVVEAVARAGFDWLGLDLQHGAWDLGTAFRGIQLADALGKPVLIRLPDEQLPLIPRVLDHGASGIVLAMASEPEVVAAAIERARYQPEGRRSYGGQRYGMRPEPADPADVRPAIYAMLETRRGIEAVGEIAAIRGLAGLHVGPTDLGLALGVGRNLAAPAFTDAIAAIVAAGHANGLPVTMHAVAASQAAAWVAMGFAELVLPTDIELLRGAFAELIRGAGAAIAGEDALAAALPVAYGMAP
jgi:2-keto-3-deoxy-L-rhamnonate aldolase RhmA